ncbi:uncharacterized protein [Oscarella lobularis]|uniref:uncharacterized protein n=1 Tax=Oscarella lobularis TaxID=121494 RepID=UPI003313D39B
MERLFALFLASEGLIAVCAITLALVYFYWDSLFALLLAYSASRGYENPTTKKREHLCCYICHPENLDQISYEQLYSLGKHSMPVPTVTDFVAYAKLYSRAAIFRCRKTGTLQGIILWNLDENATEGDRTYTCIRFGGMIFRHSLQMRWFKLVCFAYVFKVWLFNPFVPLVFTFLCKRSSLYTTLIKMTERMYPRFDADIPSWEKSLIDQCGQMLATTVGSGMYDPETCIASLSRLRPNFTEDWVEPTEKEVESSEDPHLKYYFNLGVRDMAKALICILRIDKRFLLRSFLKVFWK